MRDVHVEAVEIRVLGEVGARNAGHEVALGGPTQRRLLAVLVAAGPRGLAVEDIIEQLWSAEGRPADPHRSVRTYVNRLREALNREAIATRSGGYVVGEAVVDANRFEDLVTRARRAGDSPTALGLWAEAVGLWHGPAFDGFEDLETVAPVARPSPPIRSLPG